MIIDATDLILGRMATVVAKKALNGEKIDIVNVEKAVVSGTKEVIFAKYKRKRDMGTFKGPFWFRRPNMFVKRTIRGMLPYKTEPGAKAYKNIKCYVGKPIEGEAVSIESANISQFENTKYVTVGRICQELGL
ncbi:MAG: 50S ribosomal protein L13 [Nanoarchaeota archaeon]|nr:50S ribosomal protein L13 [Nanoarchaeota archaeon]MBU1705057.1 50S ribosomal protein L13 [Nanoarchaeota archaeon]